MNRYSDRRRVIDFVDVDSDKWRQYSRNRRWPVNLVYRREAETLLKYERHIASIFDASLFVTEDEAELFRKLAPESMARIDFFNNGVDFAYFNPGSDFDNPYACDEQVLVFTGAMDYWANVDAVTWFALDVFPVIRNHCPRARFYIVGANPSDTVKNLAHNEGISVTGAVHDIRPYLAHAAAAVAPLRIARGLQNKVLEAMAMARPVIATPAAMEGIISCTGADCRVGDNAEHLCELAIDLLSEAPEARPVPGNRQCVTQNYNWTNSLNKVGALLSLE
jgi:sugar transferase (PEP-CTERM/EpsH1 system associated)